jgi:serine/threonine protein kinase
VHIGLSICVALHYLHSKSTCHVDVKSNNILLNADGTGRLIDYGSSRNFGESISLFAPTSGMSVQFSLTGTATSGAW